MLRSKIVFSFVSLMIKLWTWSKKTQLQVFIRKAIFITKANIEKTCQEFYTCLKSSPDVFIKTNILIRKKFK